MTRSKESLVAEYRRRTPRVAGAVGAGRAGVAGRGHQGGVTGRRRIRITWRKRRAATSGTSTATGTWTSATTTRR